MEFRLYGEAFRELLEKSMTILVAHKKNQIIFIDALIEAGPDTTETIEPLMDGRK